tara:strand:- start:782 stop:1459 length:678 start_codon:yes stop_codon:yes gene_type:complete
MGLSTKDVNTEGGESFTNKTIQPGNVEARVTSITLDRPAFLDADEGYYFIVNLETKKPTDDFEGFLLDKDEPEGGRFDGQVGKVKVSKWPFKDNTFKGIQIKRDIEILKNIKHICTELGLEKWWTKVDEKYDTIEEFVDAFNKDKPFKDKYINFCICGREYFNKAGYSAYDLYLPKFVKDKKPYSKNTDEVIVFNADRDIDYAVKPTAVQDFGAAGKDIPEEFEL